MANSVTPQVKNGLNDISDVEMVANGRTHVEMLTGNAVYPTPTPALADITSACDALENSIQQVQFMGGKLAYAQKRANSKKLRDLLRTLAAYVQANCGGSAANILSAGFEVRQDPQPVEKLDMPQNLRALLTDFSGQVPLRWNTVEDALNYQVFANSTDPTNEDAWELVAFTSATRYTVEALPSATFHWFRVQALGRKGLASPMSEAVRALAA